MSGLTAWMDRTFYPDHTDNWDDVLFREVVLERVEPGHHLLDVGAGAGIVPQMDFRGRAQRICGVDPDPRVVENPFLDEGRVGVGESLPYDDRSFDLVIADNVLEHLEDPVAVFREVHRVLRPGGRFLAKTPNRLHYMPLAATLTPHVFHRFYNRLRGREAEDTFPTRYRANTPVAVERHARAAGLEWVGARLVEGRPEYLRVAAPLYLLGWLYERLVNFARIFARFRVLLIVELRRPESGSSTAAEGRLAS